MSVAFVGNLCTACRACECVCPAGAISFEKDKFGFEYPKINSELCTECALCECVCPAVCSLPKKEETFLCGAARARSQTDRFNGSSGGLFCTFAKRILENGGVVFGAAFDEKLKLKTTCAKNESELLPLCKSKYLLCDTSDAFVKIKAELESRKSVLYCSSPCQINALLNFLGQEYENLITVDFVCHGVGNQHMFDESVREYGCETFSFRHKKKNGASSHYFTADKKSGLYFDFPYYNAYCKELAYRDSCYLCRYATRARVSDITVGDFHTSEQYLPDVERFDGISMFLCNTEKGKEFFESLNSLLDVWNVDKEILYRNNRFSNSQNCVPEKSHTFREAFEKYGYGKETRKILNPRKDILKKIYYSSPSIVRKIMKKAVKI